MYVINLIFVFPLLCNHYTDFSVWTIAYPEEAIQATLKFHIGDDISDSNCQRALDCFESNNAPISWYNALFDYFLTNPRTTAEIQTMLLQYIHDVEIKTTLLQYIHDNGIDLTPDLDLDSDFD